LEQQHELSSLQPVQPPLVPAGTTSRLNSSIQQPNRRSSQAKARGSPQQSSQQPGSQPAACSNGSSNSRGQQQRSSKGQPVQLGSEQLSGGAIMRQLKATASWQELKQVMQRHGDDLNWQHSSAMITHVAQLSAQEQRQQEASIPLHLQQYSQQEQYSEAQQQRLQLKQQLWPPFPQQQQKKVSLRNASSTSSTSSIVSIQPQAEHGSLDAGLQHFLHSFLLPLIDSHMPHYDARGLANCLWAVAKLQPLTQPSSSWLQQYCSTCQPLLHQFDAQQLSNTLWGLVQLQHVPSQAWMHSWYAAMLQACSAEDPTWQPQSVSSALWALAQLFGSDGQIHSSSSSSSRGSSTSKPGPGPSSVWLHQLMSAAMHRVAAHPLGEHASSSNSKGSSRGVCSSSSSSGQVVSNLLWACVLLQQAPGLQVLRALRTWLQQLLAAQAAHAAAANDTAAAAGAGAADAGMQLQGLSDQSLANCMWALGKLYQRFEQELPRQELRALRQQGQALRRGTRPATRQFKGLICGCGKLLFRLSEPRLASTSSQHLSNMLWGAGALRLELEQSQQPAVAAVMQQLVARGDSLADQQVSNLLWGLSRVKQAQQEQLAEQGVPQQQQQQPYVDQKQQLPRPQPLQQQQWQQQQPYFDYLEQLLLAQEGRLQGFSSQAIGSSLLSLARMQHIPSDRVLHSWLHALSSRSLYSRNDMTAAVDACVALSLLRQQQATAARRRSGGSGNTWSGSISSGSFATSADGQWLQALCSATVGRLGVFSVDQLCALGQAMAMLHFRAPVSWLQAWQTAAVAKTDRMSASMAARVLSVMQMLPGVIALGAAALQSARARLAEAATGSAAAAFAAGKVSAEDLAAGAACVAAVRSRGSEQSMQQLLQAVPSVLSRCSTRHLAQLLSAAAAVQAPLPPMLLPAVLHEAQRKQHAQRCGMRTMQLLVAVAKVTHQQQRLLSVGLSAQPQQYRHGAAQDAQQELPAGSGQLEQDQQAVLVWLQQSVPQLQLAGTKPSYLSAVLWALGVLCFRPGRAWLDAWAQHSMPVLQTMQAQQLASCGWALTALRYRPAPQWLACWSQAVAQHVASTAVQPRTLALLLYCSATLCCPVNSSWLRSVGVLAARQAESWAVADVADGLWGLGQLGLRAVAEEEVVELLLGRLVEATTAQGQLQQLGPHRQLQVLQAAVLLGPGPDRVQDQLQRQQQRVKRMRQGQRRLKLEQKLKTKRKRLLRWFSWRAWSSAAVARAAATAAAGAQQQGASSSGSLSGSSSSSNGGPGVSRRMVAAMVGKAAVVAGKYVQIKTGRDPAAAAGSGILQPAWFEYWCRCSLRQLQQWRPQQVAAALAAFAALGLQPPLAWQEQMLGHVVQQGRLSLQTGAAIQDALVALRSPLVQSWQGQVAVRYIPTLYSSTARAASAGALEQQQAGPLRQQQQQQGLGISARAGSQPSYPHHLRSNTLRRLQRKQHMMRLVGWWRQQQLMQQQYAQQRQEEQQQEQLWRAAAAAAGVGGCSSSMSSTSSLFSSYSSPMGSLSSVSNAVTPSSSIDGAAGGLVVPVNGTPRGPAPRSLDSSSWGKQLQRPAARPKPAPAVAVDANDASSSRRSSSSSSGPNVVESAPAIAEQSAAEPNAAKGSSDSATTEDNGAEAGSPVPEAEPPASNGRNSSSSSTGAGLVGSQAANLTGATGVVQVVRAETAARSASSWDSWAAVGVVGQAAAGEGPVFVYGAGRQVTQPGRAWQQ
jgi:hypothetical protein